MPAGLWQAWHQAGQRPGLTGLSSERLVKMQERVQGVPSYLSFRLSMKRLVKDLTLSTRAP